MNHPAPTPDKDELREKIGKLQFEVGDRYCTLSDATKILDMIMEDIEAYTAQQLQKFKQALEEAMPKKRKQKTSTDTWTPGYNFAIDNATSALNSVYGEFTKEI